MAYLHPVKLKDDPNFILWELPPGKIDKSDPTRRVVQKSQKGFTCWYYALKRIMTEGDKEQKNALRFYSKVRKQLTQLGIGYSQTLTEQKKIFGIALNELGIDPKAEYERSVRPYFLSTQRLSWEDLSDNNQVVQMQAMLRSSLINQCQLTLSKWRPTHKIETLIHGLKKNGPSQFFGFFGQAYYPTAPFPYKKVEGRQIFGWGPGARPDSNLKVMSHAIVVVGAEKRKQRQLVYFVDPIDPSDPTDPSSQPIYVVSYQIFKANVIDQLGIVMGKRASPYAHGVFPKKRR